MNPYRMIDDIIKGIRSAIEAAQEELKAALLTAYNAAVDAASYLSDKVATAETATSPQADGKDLAAVALDAGNALVNKLTNIGLETIKASVLKYRVEVMGIVNALSGNPSTPWHITIGNPLRPIFCSGDMLTTEVTLKLGPILAFNDLPSSITADFTLVNARNLGMQEIMAKFNSGYLRTVDVQKTFFETMLVMSPNGDIQEPVGVLPGEYLYKGEASPSGTASGTGAVNQGGGNNSGDKINQILAERKLEKTKLEGGAKPAAEEGVVQTVAIAVTETVAAAGNFLAGLID
jgi:hypothetical protein